MEWRFFTENALENRRECSDCELYEFRLDVNFTVKSRLDGETPPPNRPVYVACILSLCPGLDKSEMVNAHLTEAKPEIPALSLLTVCQPLQICLD